jgi:hypothetical protein
MPIIGIGTIAIIVNGTLNIEGTAPVLAARDCRCTPAERQRRAITRAWLSAMDKR